jgi:hypothetical protein
MNFPLAALVTRAFLLFNACSSSDSAEEPIPTSNGCGRRRQHDANEATPSDGATPSGSRGDFDGHAEDACRDSKPVRSTATRARPRQLSGDRAEQCVTQGVSSNVLPGLTWRRRWNRAGFRAATACTCRREAGSGPLPLVLAFHGLGGSGRSLNAPRAHGGGGAGEASRWCTPTATARRVRGASGVRARYSRRR